MIGIGVFILGIIISLIVGVCFGVLAIILCMASGRRNEDYDERREEDVNRTDQQRTDTYDN